MKQLEVFKKIGGILNELLDQYKYIETNDPENINDLELELFVANAHFLKDHAEILNKLSQRNKADSAAANKVEPTVQQLPVHIEPAVSQPAQTPAIIANQEPAKPAPRNIEKVERALEKIKSLTTEKFFEPVVQQKRDNKPVNPEPEEPPTTIDITPPASKDTYAFEMEKPEVIRHELVVDEDAELYDEDDLIDEDLADEAQFMEKDEEVPSVPVIETATVKEDSEERIAVELAKEPVVAPEVKPEVKLEVKAEAPVKEKDEVFTINQRISAQLGGNTNVSEQTNAQPITNLKQAITLNDKLLYIKDLFNGYSLAYSEAIEILNRFNTFEEANRFLNKNYTAKNNWDSKPETTEKFYALLKRRYN